MKTLSYGSVIISSQFWVIFHNAIPQKPVQHILRFNEDPMSMLKPSLLLFSVNVRYQTSSSLQSVSQNLAHNQHKPTNKTEYSLFYIPLPIIGLTELFSIFFSIIFKFENSS